MEAVFEHLSHPTTPSTHALCARILPELLPTILSFIPLPHLHFRLVNREWDSSMKIAHSLGRYPQCIVTCKTADELLTRMQQLMRHVDDNLLPWPLHWKVNNPVKFRDADFSVYTHQVEAHLIPYLDSLQPLPSGCYHYSITFDTTTVSFPQFTALISRRKAVLMADWCLEHSKPAKYTFFLSLGSTSTHFETEEEFSSFLRSPRMNHITRLELHHQSHALTPFLDSDYVSNLKSLGIFEATFRSHDAECLVQSPHLTQLSHLSFHRLFEAEGMIGAHRSIGFDTIICSPIMKNLKSFQLGGLPDLGYCVVEAFAQSKYLTNLTHLALDRVHNTEWKLELFLQCDETLPKLTALTLKRWGNITADTMRNVITSPSSVLFNRLQSLNITGSRISTASMEVLCNSNGLKSLKTLKLRSANLTDEGLQFMASSQSFDCLECLDLRQNGELTDKSVVALYSSRNTPYLQHINFQWCRMITPNVLKEISSLQPRLNLRLLSFRGLEMYNGIKQQAVQVLEELSVRAPRLRIEITK